MTDKNTMLLEVKPDQTNSMIFFGKYPNDKEEILRLSKDGFFYKGERVDDVHNVYARFNEWLSGVQK